MWNQAQGTHCIVMGITDIRLSGSYPRTLLRNLWPFVSRPYCFQGSPRVLQVAAIFLKIVSPERRYNIYLEIGKFENSKGRRRVVKSGSSFALKRRRKKRKEGGTLDEISARPVKKRRKKKREGEKISGGRIERKMQLLSSRYYRFLRMRRMPRVYIRNFVWPCEGPT